MDHLLLSLSSMLCQDKPHQSHHSKMRRLLTKIPLELGSTVKSSGSVGDAVVCHLRVKASSPGLMSEYRGLFDMLLLFQVGLTGRGCEQISHKDFTCSAERETQTSLWSLIKAERLLPALCEAAHISYWCGASWWNMWRITRVKHQGKLLCFSSTATMVLFLIGISIAVNNSSHENQTAGNCCNYYNYYNFLYILYNSYIFFIFYIFFICSI